MSPSEKIATVFGGTGFVGRYIVRQLARAGYRVKVATRIPERAYFLKPAGTPGQIVPLRCDCNDPQSIRQTISGSSLVVNCVGILFEKRKGDFMRLHKNLPDTIARTCAELGIERFVHISALGIEHSKSHYARSKLAGEQDVLTAFPQATILRPSVIFGPEDEFFNMFATIARFLPVLPLIGGGRTKLQPVYVGDVASAVSTIVSMPLTGALNPQGRTYSIAGPEILSLREIYEMLFRYTGRPRTLVPLPFPLAALLAIPFEILTRLRLLPKPLLTRDQVASLKTDSVAGHDTPGLEDLGVQPTGLEQIVPGYLERFRSGGRFSDIKTA